DAATERPARAERSVERFDNDSQSQQPRRNGQGYNRSRQRPSRDNPRGVGAQGTGMGDQPVPRPSREPREPRQTRAPRSSYGEGPSRFEDQPPRPNAHLGT